MLGNRKRRRGGGVTVKERARHDQFVLQRTKKSRMWGWEEPMQARPCALTKDQGKVEKKGFVLAGYPCSEVRGGKECLRLQKREKNGWGSVGERVRESLPDRPTECKSRSPTCVRETREKKKRNAGDASTRDGGRIKISIPPTYYLIVVKGTKLPYYRSIPSATMRRKGSWKGDI